MPGLSEPWTITVRQDGMAIERGFLFFLFFPLFSTPFFFHFPFFFFLFSFIFCPFKTDQDPLGSRAMSLRIISLAGNGTTYELRKPFT